MQELPKEISDFVEYVNRQNDNEKNPVKHVTFSPRLDAFYLISGCRDLDPISDSNRTVAYYFTSNNFLPVIEDLRRSQTVNLSLNGVRVEEAQWYDSYAHDAPNAEHSADVQAGKINGSIRLEKGVFVEYALKFSPTLDAERFENLAYSGRKRLIFQARVAFMLRGDNQDVQYVVRELKTSEYSPRIMLEGEDVMMPVSYCSIGPEREETKYEQNSQFDVDYVCLPRPTIEELARKFVGLHQREVNLSVSGKHITKKHGSTEEISTVPLRIVLNVEDHPPLIFVENK